MNKITKILLIIFFILLFAFIILNNYTKDMGDMASKVGSPIGGGELTMREYYTLVQCIETYNDYLKSGDYETAYNMIGSSYRNYISLETYKEKMQNKNIDDILIKEIAIKTQTTFEISTETSGEAEIYSIIVDNALNRFSIYPEYFLDYSQVNKQISKKKLNCKLVDYVVNTNKCIFEFELTNTSNNEVIEISKAILHTNLKDTIENNGVIQVKPEETKQIQIEFETEYSFPKEIILERNGLQYSFKMN